MTPEATRLKALFARRDLIAGQLADIDRRIVSASEAYRVSMRYGFKPRVEALRREVGA